MKLSRQLKLDMYYYMRLGRAMEERLEILYRQGKLTSAIYLGRGQEATMIGAAMALEDGDTLAPTHRDVMAQLPRGMEPKKIFAQHFGKETSPTRGRGEATYLGDLTKGIFTTVSMLPDFYPVSCGAALSFKLRNMPNVALAFCGEGATSRGDFHEALNFASIFMLPAVFIVENNQFAYSTPVNREMRVKDVSQRAIAYDIPGESVDGNDVIAVYEITKKAVNRARSGEGPTLIAANTMRMRGHAGHDSMKYVSKELISEWEKKDPISMLEKHLFAEKLINDAEKTEIDGKVNAVIDEAVRYAEESPLPNEEEVDSGVYHK